MMYDTNMLEENDKNYEEFMSIEEVAKYLGVWKETVYRYIHDTKTPLPAMKISRKKILVKKEDLKKWLEDRKI